MRSETKADIKGMKTSAGLVKGQHSDISDSSISAPSATISPDFKPYSTHTPIMIGNIALSGRAILAPMSGVTDYPFRKIAHQWGAPLVVSEMVASRAFILQNADAMRRTIGKQLSPFVIQLAGREAQMMGEAAKNAEQLGADIIDINMGCPARQVTKGLSGSALMRDLDHAMTLIEAVINAVSVPVTLKMRLGWDDASINAPELAIRAQQAGIKAFTVHGRTRQQFYKGQANWALVKDVKQAINVPLFVNGDIKSFEDAKTALAESGADGVMIGRSAYGAPWKPAMISRQLNGETAVMPKLHEFEETVRSHYDLMLSHYGKEFGLKSARKHLGWYVETLEKEPLAQKKWRRDLCTARSVEAVQNTLTKFFEAKADQY